MSNEKGYNKGLKSNQKEEKNPPSQVKGRQAKLNMREWVEQQLSNCKEAGTHMLIEMFIKGLKNEKIKKEMRREVVTRKNLMIKIWS